jgi:hypothetical protein
MDISFLQQMIKTMDDMEVSLEKHYKEGDLENFNKIRSAMISIQKKISGVANAL